jgi:hypothetical protein
MEKIACRKKINFFFFEWNKNYDFLGLVNKWIELGSNSGKIKSNELNFLIGMIPRSN